MRLSVEETAALLHVRSSTVRSRLRAGELRRVPGEGPVRVLLEPGDYIRSEDAAAILGISPTTVRSAIGRGELAGRRTRKGRWQVRLESVLADPRAADTAASFSEAPRLPDEQTALIEETPRRPGRHDLFVRLDEHELDLLELAQARYGTKRAAVATALACLVEHDAEPGEVAELRVERDVYRDRVAELERDLQLLAGISRRQVVDELYCPTCEAMVPIDGWGYARDEQTGTIEIYHRKHGHHRRTRLRNGSVMATRQPPAGLDLEDQSERK